MSWRAHLIDEYKPPPTTPMPKSTRHLNTPTNKHPESKHGKNLTKSKYLSTKSKSYGSRTMTGLPRKVREKLEGIYVEPTPDQVDNLPRNANYTFTYVSDEEKDQLNNAEMDDGPHVLNFAQTQSLMNARLSESSVVSERLKKMKQSFSHAEKFPHPDQPSPYFQDWSPGNEDGDVQNDEAAELFHSTRNILNQTGFHGGLDSYFAGLEEMDRIPEEEDPLMLSGKELDDALSAFQPKKIPSKPKSRTEFYVAHRNRIESAKRDFATSKTSNTSSSKAPPSLSTNPIKEPDPKIFVQPPTLNFEQKDRIIKQLLKKEDSISPMTYEQYATRKRQLLEAALKDYDRDIPTYEALSDLRDETIRANEQQKAITRANIMDILYHSLTNQSTSLQIKSPSTGLHLNHNNLLGRSNNILFPRPLDQFDGAVISTAIREVQEAKASGAISRAEFTSNRILNPKPVQIIKGSKDKIKALRAIENYELSKSRQRDSIPSKPVLTLLSAQKQNIVPNSSRFNDFGTKSTFGGFSSSMYGMKGPKREESMNTLVPEGSFMALSTKTRNEKSNSMKHRSIPTSKPNHWKTRATKTRN